MAEFYLVGIVVCVVILAVSLMAKNKMHDEQVAENERLKQEISDLMAKLRAKKG